jgi:superfamily II DNA or RNA helicase
MLIKIVDNHFLYLDQITAQQDEIIYQHFSAKDPDVSYIVDTLEQSWDGWYRKYNRRKQRMALPFLDEVILLCNKHEWPVDVIDSRPPIYVPDESEVRPDILPGITLHEHQMRALRAACRHPMATIYHHTGAGKSEVMAALIKLFKCPTLVIADKIIVVDQLKRTLELREVAEEVGVFYSGRTPSGQLVCVGSIQSIASPKKPIRMPGTPQDEFDRQMEQYAARYKRSRALQQALLPRCKMLLLDECDLATSSSYSGLFRMTESVRRYGFSGSLEDPRKPLQNLILKERLGNVIDRTSRRELEKIGCVIPVKYVMFAFGEGRDKSNRTAYDIAVKELEEDPKFHKFIASIVNCYKDEKTLILVEHKVCGRLLEEAIPGSIFIYGETPAKRRWEVIHDFEAGKVHCLIGGKIIKRGLDLKGGCDNLIVTVGMSDLADFEQRIGRAMRRNSKGYARVFDFLFLHNRYLYNHSRIRLRYLVEMGYASTVVFPSTGARVSGQEFIRSKFRIPKLPKAT